MRAWGRLFFAGLLIFCIQAQGLKARRSPAAQQFAKDDYTLPLRFDVLNDGVTLSPLSLEWDLSSENNLHISDLDFNDKSFYVGVFKAGHLDPLLQKNLSKDDANEWLLIARWPRPLLRTGVMEALSRSGQVLWHQDLLDGDFDHWTGQLKAWKSELKSKKVTPAEIEKMPVMQTNLAVRKFNETAQPFWSLSEPFRICLSTVPQDGLFTRMCTRLLQVQQKDDKSIEFTAFPTLPQPARVIVMSEVAKLKDNLELKPLAPVQFFAELNSGSTYEYLAQTANFSLVEMTAEDDQVRLIAWGARPNMPVHDIKLDRRGILEKLIGGAWAQTIGDFREFWEVTFPRNNPVLYVPGKGGGLFREQFTINKLPSEKIRPYVQANTIEGTYINGAKIYGRAQAGTRLSSVQKSVRIDDPKTNEFIWKFAANKDGEINRSYLLVSDGKETYKTFREMYLGYPGEISARLTGLLTSTGSTVFLGELAANYWFESLLGWNEYYLSRQRWGASIKYFESLSPLTTGFVTDTLQDTTAAIKYRLTPGLWSKDESWGLEAGINKLNYNIFQGQFLGGGFFWGRSMPRFFGDIMDILPFFRYPKWVDLEFVYYPVSQTSTVTPNNFGQGYGNWDLNFHGKIMWTKQFFGEAGFGVKQFDFIENVAIGDSTRLRFQFTSFYGTAGLGWSF